MKAKAIQYSAYGNYEENRLVELDRPQPSDGEVLVSLGEIVVLPCSTKVPEGCGSSPFPRRDPSILPER